MERANGTTARRTKARLGVAGLGRMGVVHAQNLALRCPSAQLVALYDPRPDATGRVAAEVGATVVATYDELLSDPALDGVVIASPTAAHAELALRAARAGKHVFCEKPLSLERDVTIEVVEALKAAGVKLQVGFHRRFDPAFAAAAERVRAGELGEVYLFRAAQRDMAPPRPEFLAGSGGIFVDMGIHDFDAARWLVGEVVSVSAHGATLSDPGFAEIGDFDTAVVVLTFASGALGVLDISRVAGYGYDSSAELVGSRATVRIDEPFLHGYEWRTPGAVSRPLVATFVHRYGAAFAAELEHFARSVVDGTAPLVTGTDALAAFDLASAAAESCRLGRPVIMAPAAEAGVDGGGPGYGGPGYGGPGYGGPGYGGPGYGGPGYGGKVAPARGPMA